MTAALMHSSSE